MNDRPVLVLDRVSRRFGGVTAVDCVSLAVAPGEFFSLLGPSGCGKTTTLRLIAGFEDPEDDGGTIQMEGEIVNGKRPYARPIGMVFQNYALFPHLNVSANIAFGLEERRLPRPEVRDRVARSMELVRLDPALHGSRRPTELSGGQRQRVALARALVLEPKILLLDEPLGALDLQLRKEMQLELKRLNQVLGITFVLVTHDQEEALAMSDRIAVMHAGRVAQVGSPSEIYESPRTQFVAEFIGEANIFSGDPLERSEEMVTVAGEDCVWRVPERAVTRDGRIHVAVRPEWLTLRAAGTAPPGDNAVRGSVSGIVFLGESLRVLVTLAHGMVLRVAVRNDGPTVPRLEWRTGDTVDVTWPPERAQVLQE